MVATTFKVDTYAVKYLKKRRFALKKLEPNVNTYYLSHYYLRHKYCLEKGEK